MNNQNSVIEHKSPQNNELRRVLVVKATHEYVPVNNDELHIRVNDKITITNAEEGGWWEGTLGSRTGWFPSNYVVPLEDPLPTDKLPSNDEYKSVIVTELLESEIAYVREMEEFNENFLKKLHNLVGYQGDPVINTLNCAYVSLINAHKTHVLTPLQGGGLRIGKIFMTGAPEISAAHTSYCSNHPKFVQFVERNSDKLSGAFGDQAGVLKVISSLSAPFRRVEKYGNLLSELERYVCSFDPDKGDVQRGACYYRNLEKSLTSLRKQKEMELEILTSVRSGAIQDYEGPEVAGEIILMNLVFVGRDKQPRYFVLFSNTILILSYDNVSNTLTYKGRIYVSGITVSCIDGDDTVTHAFEISGPTLHPILVQCPSSSVRQTWLQNLNDLVRSTRCYSNPTPSNQHPQRQSSVIGGLTPPVQAWNITRLRPSAPFNPFLAEFKSGRSGAVRSSSSSSGFGGSFKVKGFSGGLSGSVSNEEDLCVLGIVDGFCNSNNRSSAIPLSRNNTNNLSKPLSGLGGTSLKGGDVARNLPQLVVKLREDVNCLNNQIGVLTRQLEEDKNVRGQLIELIGKLSSEKN